MRRILYLLFVIPLLFAAVSFAAPASASRPSAVGRMATPSDAQIDATIRAKLAKSKIGKDGFRFHVQRGVVTWEGSTDVIQHKGSATRMARTAGAVQVVNNIKISGRAKAAALANLKKATVTE